MLLDKKFRLFGKISLFDILVVILVVVLIFAANIFSAPQTTKAAVGDVIVKLTVELPKKKESFLNNVKIGETLVDSQKGYEIGKITNIYTLPYKEDLDNFEKNQIERNAIDGYLNIYMEIEAIAQIEDGSTKVGQYDIMVGKDVYVKAKSFASPGFIVKLEKGE